MQEIVHKLKDFKFLLKIFKVAAASCLAIMIAEGLALQFATAAGSIALLTVVTTKWEMIRLSLGRIVTYIISAVLGWLIFKYIGNDWISYGLFILFMTGICDLFGWAATVSVNAVIGTHFLTVKEFGMDFIWNEFLLVLIGIAIAFICNFYHANYWHKKRITADMRMVEGKLREILTELSQYLQKQTMSKNVWLDMGVLENQIYECIKEAIIYDDNVLAGHSQYYEDYFRMRLEQCRILHNLRSEMRRIRELPVQANAISDFMCYMKDYVMEVHNPQEQMKKLEAMIDDMKMQPMPQTRSEFENRALLYHVLMDLEDFLRIKITFCESMDAEQRSVYWNIPIPPKENL